MFNSAGGMPPAQAGGGGGGSRRGSQTDVVRPGGGMRTHRAAPCWGLGERGVRCSFRWAREPRVPKNTSPLAFPRLFFGVFSVLPIHKLQFIAFCPRARLQQSTFFLQGGATCAQALQPGSHGCWWQRGGGVGNGERRSHASGRSAGRRPHPRRSARARHVVPSRLSIISPTPVTLEPACQFMLRSTEHSHLPVHQVLLPLPLPPGRRWWAPARRPRWAPVWCSA